MDQPTLDGPTRSRISRILLVLIALSLMGIDLCLPSLPAIASHYQTSVARTQLTLTSFLLGFSVMQAVYGPLSERFGRRNIMLVGLTVACLGSGLCSLAQDMTTFLAARFVAGAGSSVIWVLQRSIMRDVFVDRAEMTRFASRIAATWAVTLAVAPGLGGYIQTLLGWRFQFILLTLLNGLAVGLVWRWLPETKNDLGATPITLRWVVSGYLDLFRRRQFLKYVSICSFGFGIIMAYNTLAPFVFMGPFGLSPVQFGRLGLLISAAYCATTLMNGRFGARFETNRLISAGGTLVLLGGLVVLGSGNISVHQPLMAMLPILVCIIGMGLTCPNATVAAMSSIQSNFGLASSLFGCLQMLGSTMITWTSAAVQLPPLSALGVVASAIGVVLLTLVVLPARPMTQTWN